MSPLKTAAYDADPLCRGYAYRVRDESLLARMVAVLMLGEHVHGRRIRARLQAGYRPKADAETVNEVVKTLTVPIPDRGDGIRHQRDGFVFQLISWIAANQTAPKAALLRLPHVRPADKGLDGLLIIPFVVKGKKRWAAVVCEDKASQNPRRVIAEEIWPEFEKFEARQKRATLRAGVTAIVQSLPEEERDAVIEEVLWTQDLRFRATVTVDPDTAKPQVENLFAGYEGIVTGETARRGADTLELKIGLRAWMDSFCAKVQRELSLLTGGNGKKP